MNKVDAVGREEERLRDLLSCQVSAASEEALQTDGDISPEKLARLETLARLVEIADASHPPTPGKRWPLVAALGGTLLVVSVLLFARVGETEIELDLALQEVGLLLSTEQVLTDVTNLSALAVSGLREVYLPGGAGDVVLAPATLSRPVPAVHIATSSEGERRGTLTLAALALPPGTRVWIQHKGLPQHYRVSLEKDAVSLRLDVRGPVRIGLAGDAPEQRDFASPRPVLLEGASGLLDLDVTVAEGSRAAFVPQLQTSDLSFSRIEEFEGKDRTLVRSVSTILSGTLYFEALDGLAYPLRPGQALSFGRAEGFIRTFQLREDHIALKFHGRVSGMHTGWGGAARSLMPTYLEWLKARHGLYLLWGTTLYLFGMIAGLLRWWGIRL